jgi:hypothetical protein
MIQFIQSHFGQLSYMACSLPAILLVCLMNDGLVKDVWASTYATGLGKS